MGNARSRNGISTPERRSSVDIRAQLRDMISYILRVSQSYPEYRPAIKSYHGHERIVLDVEFEGDRYVLIQVARAEQKLPALSPREQEIVRMVAQGYPNKTTARALGISSWTVCTHLRRIFAKLGVTSRAAMVAVGATRWGPVGAGPRRKAIFRRGSPLDGSV